MYRSMPLGARRSRLMLAPKAATVVSMLAIVMSSVLRPLERPASPPSWAQVLAQSSDTGPNSKYSGGGGGA
jgi:hypothetical protein